MKGFPEISVDYSGSLSYWTDPFLDLSQYQIVPGRHLVFSDDDHSCGIR